MGKRTISFFLVLVMVLGMIPVTAITAFATETEQADTYDALSDGQTVSFFVDKEPTAVSVDWDYADWESFAAGTGSAAALVYNAKVYLAVRDAGTGTVTATLGGEVETAELVNGAAVVYFDETAVTDYGQELALQVAVGETDAWAEGGKLTIVAKALKAEANSIPETMKGEGGRLTGSGDDFTINSTTNGMAYFYALNNLSPNYADVNKDLLFEQNIYIEKMAYGSETGKFSLYTGTGATSGNGYSVMFLHGSPNKTFSGMIAPDGEGNLSFFAYGGTAEPIAAVELGKKIGDKFKLGLLWGVDSTTTVYIDGVPMGTIDNAAYPSNHVGAETATVLIRCADDACTSNNPTHIEFTRPTLTILGNQATLTSEDQEITEEAIFGDLDLENVTADLPLPTSFKTSHLQRPLRWHSSDEDVVKPDGTIHPDSEVAKTVTLSVYAGDSETALWSVEVTVSPDRSTLTTLFVDDMPVAGAVCWESAPWSDCVNGAGKVTALIHDTHVYLHVKDAGEGTVIATLGSETESAELIDGAALLIFDETVISEYGQELSLAIKIGQTNVWADDGKLIVAAKVLNQKNKMPTSDTIDKRVTVSNDTFTINTTNSIDSGSAAAVLERYALTELANVNRDLLFEQNLCIEKMSRGSLTGTFKNLGPKNPNALGTNGYTIAIVYGINDTDAKTFSGIVAPADAEGNLSFYAFCGGDAVATIALGKKIGDEFKLGLLWGVDGTTTVYVDGAAKGTLSNTAVNSRYYSSNTGTVAILMKYQDAVCNEDNPAKIVFTRPALTMLGDQVDLCPVEEEITQEAIFGDLDLENVTADLPLPTTFQTTYLGEKTLRWESSNEIVVGTDGTVRADAMVDKYVTLSVFLGDSETALWSVEITVPTVSVSLNALLSEETITINGDLRENAWLDWMHFDGVEGNIAAAWTRGYLFLAVHSEEADTLRLTINGKSAAVDLINGTLTGYANAVIAKNAKTGEIEISIPLTDIDCNLTDYNQIVYLDAELAAGESVSKLNANLLTFTGNIAVLEPLSSYTKDNGPWTLLDNSITYNGTEPGKVNYVYQINTGLDHSELIVFSNEFQFDALPITTGELSYDSNGSCVADGFYYYFSDEDPLTREGTTIRAVIFTTDGETLKLRIAQGPGKDGHVFDLNKSLGEKFRITYYWYPDNTLYIYVDGVLLASVNDAGHTASYLGVDVISYRYNSAQVGTGKIKFTISNKTASTKKYDTVLDELTKNAIFGRMDLDHVQRNLPMVTTFASANFEALTLKWTSSDESVVATDGKITRHATEARSSDITVYFVDADGNEIDLWSVTVTVDPMTVTKQPAPSIIHTGFADAIVLDNVLDSEENWLLNGWILDEKEQPVGYFGTQWDQNNLYVALYTEAETAGLNINGKAFNVTMTGTVTEVKFSMEELGLDKLTAYGKTMPITVTVGGSSYEGTLKLTNVGFWGTDNFFAGLPMLENNVNSVKKGTSDTPDGNQGAKQLENGWRFYDLYNPEGTNPAGIRTYVLFMKMPVYENFGDRSEATHIEFDFYAKALPEWEWDEAIKAGDISPAFAQYGVVFSLSDKADTGKNSNVALFGIVNTAEGLSLVANRGTDNYERFLLNREIGEEFRIGLTWLTNGNMVVYIDGEEYLTIEGLSKWVNSVGDTSFVVNMVRNNVKPTSSADDMDVSLTNIGFGKAHSLENIIRNLTFDDIRGENDVQDDIRSDLVLPAYMTNGQLDHRYPIIWESSDPEIIDPETGKVASLEAGVRAVTLTAILDNKGTKEVKEFSLLVLGKTGFNGDALVVLGDTNPFGKGAEVYTGMLFNLDATNNSIVYAFSEDAEETKINLITLTDLDTVSRLNRESLRLFVSNDNITYVEIEDYKLHNDGRIWYLYDFEADARYIKVHYTHRDQDDSNFINTPGEMIRVSWNESLVIPENAAEIDVPTTTLRDQAVAIALPEDIETEGLRVALNGEILFHFVDKDGTVYVRIADPTTGILKLWNAENIELADKENVYEVTYGTRETLNNGGRWVMSLKAGQRFPDGSSIDVDTLYHLSQKVIYASTDGGYTWTEHSGIDYDGTLTLGGWGVDSKTGRLFLEFHGASTFVGTDITKSNLITSVMYSDDGGLSWTMASGLGKIEGDIYSNYALSYNDIVELKGNDGTGLNVDFLFPMGAQYNNESALCGRIAYTTDGGLTWNYSESIIIYGDAAGHEGGISEGTIMEREDGTLVYYARCQFDGVDKFAISYSLDHGVTWKTTAQLSDIYTVNTQPLMMTYDFDGFDGNRTTGAPLFMWGGNNVLGGTSYMRNPLNFAVSANGMDTFRNIQNLFTETFMEDYKNSEYITNASIQQANGDGMYISFTRSNPIFADHMHIIVNNFADWFVRTKGAYDSFERGDAHYEGWVTVKGGAEATKVHASNGTYSMLVKDNSQVTRSVPYLQNGKLSFDIYVNADSKFVFELQPAFSSNADKCVVIGAEVVGTTMTLSNGTVLPLTEGWNTICFDLELVEDTASVSINGGEAVTIAINAKAGDWISYITIMSTSSVYVDELLVISTLDAVTEITETEKTAAEAVIDQIKALDPENVQASDEAAIKAARNAYNALTQAGRDQVDRRVPTGETTDPNAKNALINYYEVLLAAEDALEDLLPKEPEIAYNSVSLKGNIGVNYYMRIPEDVLRDENAYMQFTMADGEILKVPVADAIPETVEGKTYYVFTCQVPAKEMNDIITAQFFYGEGESTEAKEYSVAAYAYEILEDTTGAYDEVKPLVEAMLNYGAAAQDYFGYNAEDPANAGLDKAPDYSGITAEDLLPYVGSGSGSADAPFYGSSLLLKGETSLRFFFQVAEGASFTATYAGEAVETNIRGGLHYVTVENISAKDLDKMITIVANGAEVTASALTYAYNVLSADEGTYADELITLAKALYAYNQAANAYFEN